MNNNMRNDPKVTEHLNAIIEAMHWCNDNKVPYSQIKDLAEASFTLATGVDRWDCGNEEKENADMREPKPAAA